MKMKIGIQIDQIANECENMWPVGKTCALEGKKKKSGEKKKKIEPGFVCASAAVQLGCPQVRILGDFWAPN